MARQVNPFAGSPIGDAIRNLSGALLSGPTPAERDAVLAKTQALRASAAKDLLELEQDQRTQQAQAGFQSTLAQLFNPMVETTNPAAQVPVGPMPQASPSEVFPQLAPDLFSQAATADLDPNLVRNSILPALITPDASNSDIARAFLLANDPLSETEAKGFRFSQLPADQSGAAVRDPVNEILLALSPEDQRVSALGQPSFGPTESQATAQTLAELPLADRRLAAIGQPSFGPTESQVDAQTKQGLTPEQRASTVLPEPEKPNPFVIQPTDGRPEFTVDTATSEGKDLFRQEIAKGSNAFKVSVQSDSVDDVGLSKTVQGQVENQILEARVFRETLGEAQTLSAHPEVFGASGSIRRLLGGGAEQLRDLVEGFGIGDGDAVERSLVELRADLESNLDENGETKWKVSDQLWQDLFTLDPAEQAVSKYADLLAFQAASAIAQQTGRALSDRDFKTWRKQIDTSSSKAWENSLALMERNLDVALGIKSDALQSGSVLGSGGTTQRPSPASSGAAAQPSTENDPLGIR